MMTCRVMFDMFSLTCLSCEKGSGPFFLDIFVLKPDFDHGMMAHKGQSLTWRHDDMKRHVRHVTGNMFIV